MARKTGISITKDEIQDAALIEFARCGYEGTKMGEIAKLSGITPGAIYIHFTSKEQLFHTLIEREFAKVSIAPPEDELPLRETLIHFGNQLVNMFKNNRAITKIMFIEGIKNPPLAVPFYNQLLRQTSILEVELKRHFNKEHGEIVPILNAASRFFLGAVGWSEMALELFNGREAEPIDDAVMVRVYTDIFLKGLQELEVTIDNPSNLDEIHNKSLEVH